MRFISLRLFVAAIAIVVIGVSTATAAPLHTVSGCQTKECHARIAAKQKRASVKWCKRHQSCLRRVAVKKVRAKKLAVIAPYIGWLGRTGACESGTGSRNLKVGLTAYNPSPFYGRYQFTMQTWLSVGGVGDPRNSDWLEQAYRAVLVLKRDGNGAWPVCGH